MNAEIAVHLIDDDEAVLDSLGQFLESSGLSVARYASASRFVEQMPSADTVACVVSDVRMPGMTGLDLQKVLSRRAPDMPLILITGHGDIDMAVAAIKAGAQDFLEKPFDEERLLSAIRGAMQRSAERHSAAVALSELRERRAGLSERQQQVMDLAVRGRTNKEIGSELGISPRTVEIYRAKVMERMEADTLADLVRIAIRLDEAH